MQVQNLIFIIVLIISIILHELAHGYAADKMGDPTPRLAGRLTLNPLAHVDWFGSVILPAMLVLSGAPFILGWAKPVPFNPHYLKNKKWGAALVAFAGPVSNFVLAGIFSVFLHFGDFSPLMTSFFAGIVVVNIVLALFNLVPIPPLDGHHILFAVLGNRFIQVQNFLKQYSMILVIVFLMFGWKYLTPLITWVTKLFLG